MGKRVMLQVAVGFGRGAPSKKKRTLERSSRDTPGKWGSIGTCAGVGEELTADKRLLGSKRWLDSLLTHAAPQLGGQRSVGDGLTESFVAVTRIVQHIKMNMVSLQQTQAVAENAHTGAWGMIEVFHNPPKRTN